MSSDNSTRRYSYFPKTLESCIEPLTRPVFKAQGAAAARLITEWHVIAGAELAHHARIEKLSFPKGAKTGGTLTVSVENGFATEFQHMQPVILERLAGYFGYRAIARIAISHAFLPQARPSGDSPQRRKKASLPTDSCRLTEKVADDELKDALQSLAKTLSGQRT